MWLTKFRFSSLAVATHPDLFLFFPGSINDMKLNQVRLTFA